MPTPQRLPIVNSDDGTWGDILNQYLSKEHYDTGSDNAANGGHQKITIRAGTASAGTAPLKFTSGTLLTTPETGAMEFAGDNYYLTDTSGPTRRKIAAYDDTSGATGDIYYRNSSGYFTRLGVGSSGDVLTVSSGLPSWQASGGGAPFADTTAIVKNNSDNTKQLKFDLSGISTATTRTLTVPNANTTIVGTDTTQVLTNKDLTSGTNTFPTLNQNTTGSAAKWTTARNLAGNSVDGSANVAFSNKFIVQGTSDAGLSSAQFLGSLATGILKNTTTTGVLSIAVAGDFPTLNQNTTGSAATLTNARTVQTNLASTSSASFDGSANITPGVTGTLPVANGGTGATTLTGVLIGNGTSAVTTIGYNTTPTASNIAEWDANKNLSADTFIAGTTSTATSGTATVLTIDSTQVQAFTGSTTQTVRLPNSSVAVGQTYTIINQSSGSVTVQSSGSNTIATQATNTVGVYIAEVAAPSTASDWTGSVTVRGKVLTVSNTLALAGTDGTTLTLPSSSDTLVGLTSTQTLTNKRITARVNTANAPGATPTINVDSYDQINFTGINAAITSLSSGISGTPTDAQQIILRFKDDGTARSITWGSSWRAVGVTLPTTTVVSKTLYVGAVYNNTDSKWDAIAVAQES